MNYEIDNTVSNDKNDWRFNGQDEYLMNAKLKLSKYEKYSDKWDHDHCEFCKEKFSEQPEDLNYGYCTLDQYYWICEKCFDDFNYMFNWEIKSNYEKI